MMDVANPALRVPVKRKEKRKKKSFLGSLTRGPRGEGPHLFNLITAAGGAETMADADIVYILDGQPWTRPPT
jgi:hypothetical protein